MPSPIEFHSCAGAGYKGDWAMSGLHATPACDSWSGFECNFGKCVFYVHLSYPATLIVTMALSKILSKMENRYECIRESGPLGINRDPHSCINRGSNQGGGMGHPLTFA